MSLITCFGLLCSCNPSAKGTSDEGLIEYEVTPVDPGNVLSAMAPNSMTLKFKNDLCVAEMETGMSAVGIKFISDNKKNVFTQLVRIFDRRYTCSADAENLTDIFKNVPKYSVKKVEEYKTIAGIKCQKVEIFEKGKNNHLFDVYFTDVFKLKKPNWWNEFSEINGMLMEYRMKRFNLELSFIAKKFDQVHIDTIEFSTKGDYKRISQDELDSYFDELK
ncbi:MAG: hypothetical protein HYU69_07630 [Bacteroidetes bacterium]|nr:hypothetical protein [Bacteroidota bacterium]